MKAPHIGLSLNQTQRAALDRRADAKTLDLAAAIIQRRAKHPDGVWGTFLTRLLHDMATDLREKT
jgi:hypothetical protein